MDKIEFRKIGSLRLHSDNVAIFGHPTDEPNYEEIREDIKRRGLQEPPIILADGTILSGHLRYASVCWVLTQRGLTPDQIKDEVIPVRIHADFESKADELEYLMDANDKRRQLDPRRIASVFERVLQVIEANTVGEKGKKGQAVQALVDRLGTSHSLAKKYCTIFGSKIVPEEAKNRVNSKDLAPSIVIDAIKFAEDSGKREKRAPSMVDVEVYLRHPKPKTSFADTVRQLTSKSALPTGGSTSLQSKPSVEGDPPPPVKPPPPPAPPPSEPVESEPEVASEPLNTIPEPQKLELETQEDRLPYSESDRISDIRGFLKEALRTVVLNDSVISNLRGLHIELTSYLLAMGLIEPPKQLSLPPTPLAQVELCTAILQRLDSSTDAQSVRDSLVDLVNLVQLTIENITGTESVTEPDNEASNSNEDPADVPETTGEQASQLAPEVKLDPAPPTSQVMPASKATTNDEESLVTSVISDFLEEINKAGVAISA